MVQREVSRPCSKSSAAVTNRAYPRDTLVGLSESWPQPAVTLGSLGGALAHLPPIYLKYIEPGCVACAKNYCGSAAERDFARLRWNHRSTLAELALQIVWALGMQGAQGGGFKIKMWALLCCPAFM